MPVAAACRNEYLLSPACRRSERFTTTATCLKPTHVRKPRRKRFFSGTRRSWSTTRRDSKLKSPLSSGTRMEGQAIEEPIKEEVCSAQIPGLFAVGALRVDDIETERVLFEELRDRFGRILEVAVHQHNGVAGGVIERRQ